MARQMPAAAATRLDGDVVSAVHLAFWLDLTPQPVRFWTGLGTIRVEGEDFLGIGVVGSIDQAQESTSGQVAGAKMTVTEWTEELVAQALSEMPVENWQGREARVWLVTLELDGNQASAAAVPILWQEMDTLAAASGGGTAALELGLTPPGADRDSPVARFYTPSDQAADFPGDTGMDRQPRVGIEPIRLGKVPVNGRPLSTRGSVSGFFRGF